MSFNIDIIKSNRTGNNPLNATVHFELRGKTTAFTNILYRSNESSYTKNCDQVCKLRAVNDEGYFYIDAYILTPDESEYQVDSEDQFNFNLYDFFTNNYYEGRTTTLSMLNSIETVDNLVPSSIVIVPETVSGELVRATCNILDYHEQMYQCCIEKNGTSYNTIVIRNVRKVSNFFCNIVVFAQKNYEEYFTWYQNATSGIGVFKKLHDLGDETVGDYDVVTDHQFNYIDNGGHSLRIELFDSSITTGWIKFWLKSPTPVYGYFTNTEWNTTP